MCSNAARTILLVHHVDREYCTRNSVVVHALSFLSTTSLNCLFDKRPPVVSSGCLDYIVCDNYGRRMPPSWSSLVCRNKSKHMMRESGESGDTYCKHSSSLERVPATPVNISCFWSPSYVRRRLEARLQYVSPLRTRPGIGYC